MLKVPGTEKPLCEGTGDYTICRGAWQIRISNNNLALSARKKWENLMFVAGNQYALRVENLKPDFHF